LSELIDPLVSKTQITSKGGRLGVVDAVTAVGIVIGIVSLERSSCDGGAEGAVASARGAVDCSEESTQDKFTKT
jgi:hypothetical protein